MRLYMRVENKQKSLCSHSMSIFQIYSMRSCMSVSFYDQYYASWMGLTFCTIFSIFYRMFFYCFPFKTRDYQSVKQWLACEGSFIFDDIINGCTHVQQLVKRDCSRRVQGSPSISILIIVVVIIYYLKFKLYIQFRISSKMLISKGTQFSLEFLMTQICKEGLCNRPQWLYAVWQATKKIISNNWYQGKETILGDSFISKGNKENSRFRYSLQPTESLLLQCGLKYRNEVSETMRQPSIVTEVHLYKNINTPEKQYFKNDKQLLLRFFYLIISKIREIIKGNRNAEISLDNFGIIRIIEKNYSFEGFTLVDKNTYSAPNLHKFKRVNIKKDSLATEKSEQSKLCGYYVDTINQGRRSPNLIKRPYFHEVIVENQPDNIRVDSDLLGAGIDPLTFDYSYSKLIDNSKDLLSKQFKKPEHSQGRLPCVIDKFSRTKGSQLTGIKVGNSIIVRIGSNYSPTFKNYYLDITTKSIQFVTPEVKIKLDSSKQRMILPANEEEEYLFVTASGNKQLESRVELRKQMYLRYCEYYKNLIPNDCVAPLKRQVIERIAKNIKGLAKKIGHKDGSPLVNALMSEVNNDYYKAYKKSVLDYILKDKEEMVRTGVSIIFKPAADWGRPLKRKICPQFISVNSNEAKRALELNHILYPECLNRIYEQNEKLMRLQVFKKLKEGEYRPYNILYYIKRNINQLNEAQGYFCQSWVKCVANLIEQSINLKHQNYQKLKQFFNSIHIVMSNKLKELLYVTLSNIFEQFSKFEGCSELQSKNLLIINMTEEGERITFIDDIQKVFKIELLDIIDKIMDVTRRIPRVEYSLKLSSQIFIWGIDQKDKQLTETKSQIKIIIQDNFYRVIELRAKLSKLQSIFALKQEIVSWCKQEHFRVNDLKLKLQKIESYQQEIGKIQCFYKVNMVVVDCIDLKRKLLNHLKSFRKMLFERVEESIKQRNNLILTRINNNITTICKGVASTAQYVQLSKDIEHIKNKQMQCVQLQIDSNFKDVIRLFELDGFCANYQLMRSTYLCRLSFGQLSYQLKKNQKRLAQQRVELERRLRQKISQFQNQTLVWLKEITAKIDTFDMRKIYSEYLAVLGDYYTKVQANKQRQRQLNGQEQDLKWAATTFTHASQLQNIVEPNYELWQLVAEFDACMKQWKYIELSNFDIENGEKKISNMDNRITRLIVKLKNFAGLKIIYDLQNDVKQFLAQQVAIIKIFSNPGLKQRHWSLFNKRLPLPGYDLKTLTYGRIKLLYQYEKNLKVLMSISNQAGMEFQIEKEKQTMYEYWAQLNFSLEHVSDQNIIFIGEAFLDQQIDVIEHHLTKTVILKNSPFSKALVQLLIEWENWLFNGKKILVGFRASQQKFLVVRSIFKMDEISKLLPIEATEYDSIENIWKSVIKKILDQPKITQFFKSQKMPQIIEQIGKKADFIKNSFNGYLNLKRIQFNRLYFVPEKTVLYIISLLAADQTPAALQHIIKNCFIGINSATREGSSTYLLTSACDSLRMVCQNLHTKKGKSKFFQQLVVLERNMKDIIKKQIKDICYANGNKPMDAVADSYTLTAIFTSMQIEFTSRLQKGNSIHEVARYFQGVSQNLMNKVKGNGSLRNENLLSKSLFLQWRCQQLARQEEFDPNQTIKFINSNDNIQIKVYDQTILYEYEYQGDQVPIFIPTSTDRLLWQVAYSIRQNVVMVCDHTSCIKQLALLSGKYFVKVDNPLHSEDNNFESCIMGALSTSFWIHFIDEHLQFTMDMLNLLTQTYQQKKERLSAGMKTISFRSTQLSLDSSTALFLSLPPAKYKALPQGLLTCTRSLAIVSPNLSLMKSYLNQQDLLRNLRNYLIILQYETIGLSVNTVWSQVKSLEKYDLIRQKVKQIIWKYLNYDQRTQFSQLFDEVRDVKDEGEAKSWSGLICSKQAEIKEGLKWSDFVFVIGQQTCKSSLIEKILKEKQVSSIFNQNRGLNLSFIEEGISQLTYIKYLQKSKERVVKQGKQIYIYIDTEITPTQIAAIKTFQHNHKLSPEYKKPLKIIVETCTVAYLEPSSLIQAAIISISHHNVTQQQLYKLWVQKIQLPVDDKITLNQLESNFESLLNLIHKMQKRLFNDSKVTLARRFFAFFEIYLAHLNSKQVERMCEFDRQSYIFNSFIYCAYWAFGVCSLRSIQAQSLKKYIKQVYGERLQTPGELDQIYLNEDNEWVYWQNLKEQFVSEKQNIPLYQLWVPTAGNTRLLTTLIKLIEHQHSIIIFGSQSGRSSLMNEISSFQLTYNTFLFDCHRKTSINHFTNLTKGRILYGDHKKNLILVDDLHLPVTQVCDVLRTFAERGYCPNSSPLGKLNQNIFKPSILASWQGFQFEEKRCFWRLYGKTLPLQLQKFAQGQIQAIFRTYFNCKFLSNEVDTNILKLQNTIVNFCSHTAKVFTTLGPNDMRLLIESICRLGEHSQQKYILQHLLVEAQSLFQAKLSPNEITHFYRHISYYYSKILGIQLKNHLQLKQIAEAYIYEIKQKEGEPRLDMEEIKSWMQEVISQKSQDITISYFHVKVLQRLYWAIKGNNSHVILLSNTKSGCRTLAKMAAWLMEIAIMELVNMGVGGLLQEIVKILKTGGKVDECIIVFSSELLDSKPELLKLIHSLIFSPEFHECFGQILMEQIIKSFNSQKKFLKKNVKKSQLIKRIRQKFNSIFHFCVCLSRSALGDLLKDFPKFKALRFIQLQQWPAEAYTTVSKRFIGQKSDNILKAIFKIEQQLKNSWQIWRKSQNTSILTILEVYKKLMRFMEYKQKSHQQNTQLWPKKIKLNQDRMDNLLKDKQLFQIQHAKYFQEAQRIAEKIVLATSQYEKLRQQHDQQQSELQVLKGQCQRLKDAFEKQQQEVHNEFQNYIQRNQTKLKEEASLLSNEPTVKKMAQIYELKIENTQISVMELINQFEKDFFHKLQEIDSKNLGLISTIIINFSDKMGDLWTMQNELNQKLKSYQHLQSQFYEVRSKMRDAEDKVSDLKDEQITLKETDEPFLRNHEDLKNKIVQIQSITSILKKFQHILKTKNQIGCPIPNNLTGCALLASYLLIYAPLISLEQSNKLSSMICQKLQELKIITNSSDLPTFLDQEQQFKLTNLYSSGVDEVLALLGMECSQICCLTIGQLKSSYEWLNRLLGNRSYIWFKENDEIKDLLQRDHIILIKNPDRETFEKLSKILLRKIEIKQNIKTITVDEQTIIFHDNTKCIFIYDNLSLIPKELLLFTHYAVRIFEHPQIKITGLLEKKAQQEGLISARSDLVSNYLKGIKQIEMMDQKIHSIIMRMKKQNVVSQIIYKKIEEEGYNKLEVQCKLEKYKTQLLDVSKYVQSYNSLVKQILDTYDKFKDGISFSTFEVISGFIVTCQPYQRLREIPNKIENYLKMLMQKDYMKKMGQTEKLSFQQFTINIINNGVSIINSPDLYLGKEYLSYLHKQANITLNEIMPEDINNSLKQKEHYVCLISRQQQWKNINLLIQNNKEKLASTNIIVVMLNHLTIPPLVQSIKNKIPFNNIVSFLIDMIERKQEINDQFAPIIKEQILSYQRFLDSKNYLALLKEDKGKARQLKVLLDFQ